MFGIISQMCRGWIQVYHLSESDSTGLNQVLTGWFSLQAHMTEDWFGPTQTQRKKQSSNSRRKNQNGRKDASSHNVILFYHVTQL